MAAGSLLTGGAVAAVFVGSAIGAGLSYASQAVSGELNWGQFALDIGAGAITGAIGASGLSRGIATALSGAIGSGSSIVSDIINGNSVNWGKAAISGAVGTFAGFLGGMLVNNIANDIVAKNFGEQFVVDNPNYARSGLLKLFQWLNTFR